MFRRFAPVLAVAVALVAACSSGVGGPSVAPSNPAASDSKGEGVQRVAIPGCGDRIDALSGRPGPLAMTGEFPPEVGRGGDGTFAGTVTVTRTGPRVSGVSSPNADVFVALDGKVVSTPLPRDLIAEPFDLDSGAGKTFGARGAIRPCAGGADRSLPAGHYEVFAVVVVSRADGSAVAAVGGPWPLEVT